MNYAQTLTQLIDGRYLSFAQMQELMEHIMKGQLEPAAIAAAITALRIKGETIDEIAAAASVMRHLSSKVDIAHSNHLVDTCGTGGDGIKTFNISTASAIVTAAAGACVAKHGGRSVSSSCGSADVLEKLGVNVSLNAEQVAECVNQLGIGFMFAPNHHSAMKHAAPVRKALGVRTIFNLLGPLTNPANARHQVLGVFSPGLTGTMARVLQQLGSQHVLVVHGSDGMDEISISGPTTVTELKHGQIDDYQIEPQQFGLKCAPIEQLRVEQAQQAAEMLTAVLDNQDGAPRDIVLLNAGAAIYAADLTDSLAAGIALARHTLKSGSARDKLQQLVTLSQQLTS